MENTGKSTESKNITVGSVASWLIGIILIIAGVSTIVSSPLSAIVYIVLGIIFTPVTSKKIEDKFKFKLSKGIKIVILILGIIFAATLSSDAVSNESVNTSDNKTEDVVEEEAIKVSAVELSSAYSDNKVSADMKYERKVVEVSGVIDSIGKDILDTAYVTLKGPQTSLFGVQCMFSKEHETELANLSKGSSIVLKGRMSGELVGNVVVRDRSIVR